MAEKTPQKKDKKEPVAKAAEKKAPVAKSSKKPVFAVVETGGKQYVVHEGESLTIEKIPAPAKGKVTFDKVLLVDTGADTTIGTPYVDGAKVEAEYIEEGKGKKISVLKYKRKVRYRVRRGHRQPYTKVKIASLK